MAVSQFNCRKKKFLIEFNLASYLYLGILEHVRNGREDRERLQRVKESIKEDNKNSPNAEKVVGGF